MKTNKLIDTCKRIENKNFMSFFFGCRVNAAESNQLSQIIINQAFKPLDTHSPQIPGLIIINTCSITQKGENESLRKIRSVAKQFPQAKIIITGCANIDNIKPSKNIIFLSNPQKREILKNFTKAYTHKVGDRLSLSDKYLLNVQTGCNHFCAYCIVPYKRQDLWCLPIKQAVDQTNQAFSLGFKQLIITGINLNLYTPGFTNLIKAILTQINIPKISFGSIPLNCINQKFLKLLKKYPDRFINFLHIPLQSCSDKTLKNMNRPYTQKQILDMFSKLKKIKNLKLGTDIIVGFPGETDDDFQQSYNICKQIAFTKIHTFKYSPRPGTAAIKLKLDKIDNTTKKSRSQQIRSLINKK